MSQWNNPHDYLVPQQRIPGYLAYPHEVTPGNLAVPNEAFGFWPQGQFAPEFFPPGSKSFQDFKYPSYSQDEVLGTVALQNPDAAPELSDSAYVKSENTKFLLFFGAGVAAGLLLAATGYVNIKQD